MEAKVNDKTLLLNQKVTTEVAEWMSSGGLMAASHDVIGHLSAASRFLRPCAEQSFWCVTAGIAP